MRINIYSILTFLCLTLLIPLVGCEDDDKGRPAPIITLDDQFQNVDGFNVGDEVRITVNVKSSIGIRRLAYYFITTTDNGTQSGTPVFIDPEDFPTEITEEIVFTVAPGLVEVVIISFDRDNNNSEVHIKPESIRSIPLLAFKDGIKSRETVFENKNLRVQGTITSEYDLAAVSYYTIKNGVASDESTIAIADKKSMPFEADVVVEKGLTAIVIKAENIHEGTAIDTFKIGSVADDDVNIILAEGKTSIPVAYVDHDNILTGNVFSGSEVVSLTYAVKSNDTWGAEQPVTIGDPADEFGFSIDFEADKDIQAVRITGSNAGAITRSAEYAVEKVYTKLLHFTDITLTSAIGPGLNNWFSAWQAPHVFDINTAPANDHMLDFMLGKYSATAFYVMCPAIFNANATYKTVTDPYMVGFDQAPYTMVTVNRNAITPEAFDNLEWDGQMNEFLAAKVRASVASGGENYNFYNTNRRFNGVLEVGKGFIIGWGKWDPIENKAFGLVMVKAYSVVDGVATATFEIKVPTEDMRTKYNPESIFNYP